MQKTVWDALAELPRWQDLPMIALRQPNETTGQRALTDFTPGDLDELQQLLQRLQHHWHIRTDKNYPWRGFKAERYALQLRDEVISLIDKIRGRGDKLRSSAAQYAQALGMSGSIADLLRLGDLLEKRPPFTQASWLTTPDLAALGTDFEKCADQYQRLGQTCKPLTESYGAGLWKLAAGSAAKIEQAWKNAAPLLGAGDERGAEFLKQQHRLSAWAAETQNRVPGWLTELRHAGEMAGGAAPRRRRIHRRSGGPEIRSVGRGAAGLLAACDLWHRRCAAGQGLAGRSLVCPQVLDLITASKPAFLRYKQNRLFLLRTYTAKLFDLDLAPSATLTRAGIATGCASSAGNIARTAGRSRNVGRWRTSPQPLPTT